MQCLLEIKKDMHNAQFEPFLLLHTAVGVSLTGELEKGIERHLGFTRTIPRLFGLRPLPCFGFRRTTRIAGRAAAITLTFYKNKILFT
jgi:hypothetical protein